MGPYCLVTSCNQRFRNVLTYLVISAWILAGVVDGFCMWNLGTFSNILLSSLSSFNPSLCTANIIFKIWYVSDLQKTGCYILSSNTIRYDTIEEINVDVDKWEDCDWVPIYHTYTTLYWPLSQFSNRHITCFHNFYMFTFRYRYLKRIRLTHWVCFHGQYIKIQPRLILGLFSPHDFVLDFIFSEFLC